MIRHVVAWVVAFALISGGFALAGCEPEGSAQPVKTITCHDYGRECK